MNEGNCNTAQAGSSKYLRKEMNPRKGQVYNFRSFRKTASELTFTHTPQGLHLNPHKPESSAVTEAGARCCPWWSQQKLHGAQPLVVHRLRNSQDRSGSYWACCSHGDEWQCAPGRRSGSGRPRGEGGSGKNCDINEVHMAQPWKPGQCSWGPALSHLSASKNTDTSTLLIESAAGPGHLPGLVEKVRVVQ